MAIAFDSANEHYNAGPVTSDTWSFTNTAGDFLVVFGFTNGVGDDMTAVTYGGDSLTKINSVNLIATQWLSAWYRKAPKTGANNIIVTLANSTDVETQARTYTGTNTSSQPDSSNTGTAVGNLTLSTTVVTSNSWLASCARDSSTGTMGAGTGTTIRGSGTIMFSGDSNAAMAPGSQSMQWTAAVGTSAGCIISFAPAAGGSAVPTFTLLGVGV